MSWIARAKQRVESDIYRSMSFIQPIFHLSKNPSPPSSHRTGYHAARRSTPPRSSAHRGARGTPTSLSCAKKFHRFEVFVAARSCWAAHSPGLTGRNRDTAWRPRHPPAARRYGIHPARTWRWKSESCAPPAGRKSNISRPPAAVLPFAAGPGIRSMECRRTNSTPVRPCGKWAGTQSMITPIPARWSVVHKIHKVLRRRRSGRWGHK